MASSTKFPSNWHNQVKQGFQAFHLSKYSILTMLNLFFRLKKYLKKIYFKLLKRKKKFDLFLHTSSTSKYLSAFFMNFPGPFQLKQNFWINKK